MLRVLNSRIGHYALLLTISAALTLPNLGASSLWDIDEGLNAEAAREMLESGNWIVPTFNFKPRTAKPALLYWLQAIAYQRYGVNEFAARLPSALAAIGVVLLTYELGRRMFSPTTGLLAGVIVISSVQVSILAHAATPDALLLFSMTLTFWLFWIGSENDGRQWPWTIGIGCGLALLAKGPVGVVMPMAIIGYYFLAQRQLTRIFDRRLMIGLALMILIAGPWYALVGAETRGRFITSFWQNENVGRFLKPKEGHWGPIGYYLLALTIGLAPWSIVLIPSIWNALKSSVPTRLDALRNDSPRGRHDASRFLLCWVAVYISFFSLAQTKLPNYVVPVYPALAILTAQFLVGWLRGEITIQRWVMPAALICLVLVGIVVSGALVVVGGAVSPSLMQGRTIDGLATWAWIGLIPILGAVIGISFLRRNRRAGVVTAMAACAIGFIGMASALSVAAFNGAKAPNPLVDVAAVRQPDSEIRIAALFYFRPSLVFYCQREVSEIYSLHEAVELLSGPLPAYVFCPANVGELLTAHDDANCRLVGRQRDALRGVEVVVVTNR